MTRSTPNKDGAAAGLLQDILANPDDDTTRLVYSDWLEEHGDPARAEFIRLQSQLAQLSEFDPRRTQLVSRETELLRVHQQTWLEDVPKWARPRSHAPASLARYFQRGFLAVLECTTTAWLRGAAGLLRRTPLQHLRLRSTSASQLDQLGESLRPARLKELQIHDGLSTPADVGKIALWTHLDGLAELNLCRNSLGDDGVAIVANLPWLERTRKLILHRTSVSDRGLQALADSPRLANLTALDLQDNQYSVAGVVALTASPYLKQLASLSLSVVGGLGASLAPTIAQSAWFPSLRRLEMPGAGIGAEGALALADSPHLAGLAGTQSRLQLVGRRWCNRTGGVTASERLTHFDLTYNQLGDSGAVALAGLPQSARLRVLNLMSNDIGPAGAKALADSVHLAGLQRLWLLYNPVGAAREALRKRFGDRVLW